MLLLLLSGGYAQTLSQYEYWTDDDYANRNSLAVTGDDVKFSISTSSLNAGVHFLNFRACRDDGVWGNFYRYLFYIPSQQVEAGNVMVEYWLDDELAGIACEEVFGGNLSLSLDVSSLAPGAHYFNCVPIDASGTRGTPERYLFYVPNTFNTATYSPLAGFEYWLDDNYSSKKSVHDGTTTPVLKISIGGLECGVHYFNCRAFNERGEYGTPVREMFYIPDMPISQDIRLSSYEYWLDDDYVHRVKDTSANVVQAFTIDVSHLKSGIHYFNYWATDNQGRRGNVVRRMFYLAQLSDESSGEMFEYEYWLDADTGHKTTGYGFMGDILFNIDASSLDLGPHTFSFRAANMFGTWGNTITEEFIMTLFGDVNGDGIVGIGDIVAVTNIMAGNTAYMRMAANADVNGDGEVGIGDIVAITNIMAGSAAARQQ